MFCQINFQITVRSSPLMPETVPVCRQCHENCLSSNGTVNGSMKNYNDCNSNSRSDSEQQEYSTRDSNINENDDWQHLMLQSKFTIP